jgi:hypothetical protein
MTQAPDSPTPKEIAVIYLRHHRLKDDGDFWAWRAATDALFEDPERAWTILLELVTLAEPDELGYVGAGLLEDLCQDHGSQFIDRIEARTATDSKFKCALAAIWLNSLYAPEDIVRRLVAASGGAIEPFALDYDEAETQDGA